MEFFTKLGVMAVIAILSFGCVATEGDFNSLYARQTRLEAKMDRLSKEISNMKTADSGSSNDIELREKVYQLEREVQQLNQKYASLQSRSSAPPVIVPEGSGSELGPSFPEGAREPEVSMEETIFNSGYTALSDGNYREARDQFKLFLSKYPESSKASDATYWIAESYYRQGQFEEAILEYQRFIDSYPDDGRVPLCYLKQGLSLVELGKEQEAKLFFQTLIDKYPQSEEAATAKEKIRELAVTD